MPIVSSQIVKWRDRGNGRLAVFEQHTDHLGTIHERRPSRDAIPDLSKEEVEIILNQEMLDSVPKLESRLIEQEKKEIQEFIKNSGDPADIIRKHITVDQMAKAIIRGLSSGEPVNLFPAATFVNGFNTTQLRKFFTNDQVTRIEARVLYILDNQIAINGDIREELYV